MTTHTPADARHQIDQIVARYDALFAGQPRISRDANVLDEMLGQLNALAGQTARMPAADRDEINARIVELKGLYAREADAIRSAQAQGPDALKAHRLASWAYLTFARYRHHFAGQSRGTRDLGLVGEMVADLQELKDEMGELAEQFSNGELSEARDTLRQNLALYIEERKAIAEARGDGELSDQADRLAGLANDQFGLYQKHFAGKSRLSRRPMLLDRIIEQLLLIHDRMKALQAQGLHADSNKRNIQIVQERVAAYKKELEAVNQARAQTDFPSLVNALGGAANEVFEEYRKHFAGQDRKTRDLGLMVKMLDELWDVARQMDDLDQVRRDDVNHRNLQIVLDHLRMYDREHQAIVDAQKAKA
ncbi:MAG: hypothetical protein KC613_03815 [Myxococcales bacterium]|nr:hypothetical protein [Myxococcales bacterium]MCB9522838.1 hypothetical protein [Myxococcales bacterium]